MDVSLRGGDDRLLFGKVDLVGGVTEDFRGRAFDFDEDELIVFAADDIDFVATGAVVLCDDVVAVM